MVIAKWHGKVTKVWKGTERLKKYIWLMEHVILHEEVASCVASYSSWRTASRSLLIFFTFIQTVTLQHGCNMVQSNLIERSSCCARGLTFIPFWQASTYNSIGWYVNTFNKDDGKKKKKKIMKNKISLWEGLLNRIITNKAIKYKFTNYQILNQLQLYVTMNTALINVIKIIQIKSIQI